MKSLLFITSALAVMGLAFWAYQENYRTQAVLRDLRALHDQIGTAHARLRMLNAEWAYLNRPDRLAELALINFNRLELLPLSPSAFGTIGAIAMPPAPLSPILNPVELSYTPDPNEEPL